MIDVIYKCRCLKDEVTVPVRYRHDGEDILDWMKLVVRPALMMDHVHRSPKCQEPMIEYAKVPAPENAPFAGGKPVVH